MRVKREDGQVQDVAVTEVTAQNYIVPEGEEHLYHCIIEVRKFDSETGRRLSHPRVQKFGKKAFETSVQSGLTRQGYTVDVLYDPTEYLATADRVRREKRQSDIEKAVEVAVAKAVRGRKKKENED